MRASGRDPDDVEGLLRALAPRVLGAVVRRFGHFADAEDAVQEALVTGSSAWPHQGIPDNPQGWLVTVAARRMTDVFRTDEARRRRENVAASWTLQPAEPGAGHDDTLTLFYMCCHPALAPRSAVALTLRALGGLTTRQIAAAFLVPEATMGQRISRAKRTLAESGERFALPDCEALPTRTALVCRVVYLVYNEGYAASDSADLGRVDLVTEAVRLGRLIRDLRPDDSEVTGLLALMLLTEARRPARTGPDGALVPLAEQDRTRWDRALVAEGLSVAAASLAQGPMGEYATQAAVAALHDQAARHEDTDWQRILALYAHLEQVTANPVVRLNRAVAVAMVEGHDAGLGLLDELAASGLLAGTHRVDAVRGHLLEQKGDLEGAKTAYVAAAAASANARERDYLTLRAAALHAVTPPSRDR